MERRSISMFGALQGFVLLLIAGWIFQIAAAEEGRCIWYGMGCEDGKTSCYAPKNKLYTGPGKPVTDSMRERLQKTCGFLSDLQTSCCDAEQLDNLNDKITLASTLLARCPTCMDNFAKHICSMTCLPTHSQFIHVNTTTVFNDTTFITSIDYYLSDDYKWGLYNSCKKVQFPSTNQRALDIMCGADGAAFCTPQKWFTFMGNPEVPIVPFGVNYPPGNEPVGPYTPYNPPTLSCSIGVNFFLSMDEEDFWVVMDYCSHCTSYVLLHA